jgi:hypothetical protein
MASKGIVWNPYEPVIEKGLTAPAYNWCRFPWRKMEIGDSFFVRDEEVSEVQARKNANNANTYTGMAFVTKHLKHETTGEMGTRTWRVTDPPCVRYEIEKGISHPPPQHRAHPDIDWASMGVGDVVRFPYAYFPPESTRLPRILTKIKKQYGYQLRRIDGETCHLVRRIS